VTAARFARKPLTTSDATAHRTGYRSRVLSPDAAGKVLVVDDNAENRALAQATLDDEGIACALASSGADGVAAFVRERPDCILLDIRMPDVDGIEACRRIRALPGGDRVAIVFVTAQRDVETFDRALAAGGDDFITKPFRPNELVVRVQTALRLRQVTAERGELAVELKHQRDELLRLQLQKEQLSAFLVHDFKNPVNAIELQAQRITRNAAADARARDAATKICDETRALMRMITNLLDITRADEAQLAPVRQILDPRVVIEEALGELRARAAASGLDIAVEVEASRVHADRDLLHRVLTNLLENAIRHGPEGSVVQVSARRDGRATELRVTDAGPGVPPDQRERVFERFVTGETSARGNRGLGLAFCRLAVTAHGGTIWIEDARPGAAFCVRIPDAD
jgi:two-component system, sensor histidine kinase and response regulator